MNFGQIIKEYEKRGDTFTPAELKELKSDPVWTEQCDWCESCKEPLLHDDEVYTDRDTGEWLCDDCSIQHEDGSCTRA